MGRHCSNSVGSVKAPIRIGLQLPRFEYPEGTPDGLFEQLARIAQTAEASGFDSLFVMDHLHQIPGVGPQGHWMLEGNTILAALAARTQRLQLGLMVGGVIYRNPALRAKITTTLDVVSGGRAIHGDRRGVVRGRAQRVRLRLSAAEGAVRAARGSPADRARDVHAGARFLRGHALPGGRRHRTTRGRSAATSRSSSAAAASGRRCASSRSTPTAATSSATPSGRGI